MRRGTTVRRWATSTPTWDSIRVIVAFLSPRWKVALELMLVGQFQQDKSTPATAVPPSSVCLIRHRTAVHGTDTWTAEVADRHEAVAGA
jgi:hypothetical protein